MTDVATRYHQSKLASQRGGARKEAGVGLSRDPVNWEMGKHGPLDDHEKRLGRAAVQEAVSKFERESGLIGVGYYLIDDVIAALGTSAYFARLDADNSLERQRITCAWLLDARVLTSRRSDLTANCSDLVLADLSPPN